MVKTYMANKENIERKWYVIDATDKTLGRLATQIATILRGKHKPIYTPHVDTGDHVIVINAEKVRLTGNKLQDKKYYRHSGYPGGLRVRTAGQILSSGRPEQVLKLAVKGMLPHNRLGRKMFKKLKVYAGNEHPHSAQKPEKLDI
ncbi:MAG: 50S ribosomal protein L13 [Candidatus Wallacebacter cryptica]